MAEAVKNGHDFEYKFVNPSLLKVETTYQRELNGNKVNKIVKNWNDDVFNAPKVCKRDDGLYYIFDGQHSVAAHKIVKGENEPILCKVYKNLTWEDEKNLFVTQNGVCSQVNKAQILRAEFNGKNPIVVGMVDACARLGFIVDFNHSNGQNRIVAVSALFNTYVLLGENRFTKVLRILRLAWDGDPDSLAAGFIKGLAVFVKKYENTVADGDVAKSIGRNKPAYYMREAKSLLGKQENRFYRLFVEEYNYKRTTKRIEAI